jgi:hypothetical protein
MCRSDPRCIRATHFEKDHRPSFLVLHETIVTRQSSLSCRLRGVPYGEARTGGERMMRQPRFAALALLCGTVALAGSGAARLGGFDSSGIENTATPIGDEATRGAKSSRADAGSVHALASAISSVSARATSYLTLPAPHVAPAAMSAADAVTAEPVSPEPDVALAARSAADAGRAEPVSPEPHVAPAARSTADAATVDQEPRETTFVLASVSATDVPGFEAESPDSQPTPPRESRAKLVNLFGVDPADEEPIRPPVRRVEILHECLVAEICIDEYLWALYERTPKLDTNKVTQRVKATVKHKGKTRTVMKTVVKYVPGDFTWKDPIAAQRAGMSLKDYVIGGMDRSFKLKLFRALRAMEDAGHLPGITSAFRDDYRQAIAVGNKAASDSSFHGGSRRGGYGHGLAADLVSVDGATRMQRFAKSVELWKWIDANEKELEIGRPYLDRDPPHVGPKDGREFVAKRGGRKTQVARLQTKKAHAAKASAKKAQTAKVQATKPQAAKPETRADVAKVQSKKAPATKLAATKPQAAKPEAKRPRAVKVETKKPQAMKLETKKREAGARNDAAATPRAKPAKPAKVSSLQNRASVQR